MAIHRDNKLVKSAHYASILRKITEETVKYPEGKFPVAKFFRLYVEPAVPNYNLRAFRAFLKVFDKQADQMATRALERINSGGKSDGRIESDMKIENSSQRIIADAKTSTRLGIARALQVGSDALAQILEDPESMSLAERTDILFRAMRAQDSRIVATAQIRKDAREEKAFQKVFGEAIYDDDEIINPNNVS